MRPLFVGNHPAIDFLNTALAPNGEPIETMGDGAAYLQWLVDAGLMTQAAADGLARRVGAKALEAAAVEARMVREWARDWITRWRAKPKRDYREELAVLNKLLSRCAYCRQVAAVRGEMTVIEQPRIETADALIALVAAQFAALITEEEASLVKACAGAACTLWFLDRSKAHLRLFCSPSVCGNRAKVAAFRERQREDGQLAS
jgi:predicted RNA-binding Zn ribbon-like protein